MEYVRTLKAIHRADKDLVGERAADLALLEEKDYVVPLTYVLTNETFEAFIVHNKLQEKIGHALSDPDTNRSYDKVREHVLTGQFSKEMVAEIVEAYESLDIRPEDSLNQIVEAGEAPYVSVILSPNHVVPAESGEGIILNVKGLEELLIAIKECWACLFTPSMQRHRKEAGIPNNNLNTGVLVQHMPRGDISAEAWSAVGSDTQHLIVKTYIGAIDIGMSIEKDEFKLTREYLKPILSSVAIQTEMYARDEEGRLGKVPIGARGEEQKLNDKMVIELARLAKKASQICDGHVKIHCNVDGETVKTLLCTRLLLTKGSIKLEGYAAEERIEEAIPPTAEHVEVESETTTIEVDDESGEEEIVQQEHAVVGEEALDAIDLTEEIEEAVEEESLEASGTEEEAYTEETTEPEYTPVPEPEPVEEPAYEPEPAPELEPEEESIFAGVETEVEEAVAEEAQSENLEEETATEETPETTYEEDVEEEVVPEEPSYEETVEEAVYEAEPEEVVEEVYDPLEEPTEEAQSEIPEPVAEETEPAEEPAYETPEPVEAPEPAYTEVEQEETIVEVDEETGEEEVVSDDHEGAVVEGHTPATIERTLKEAYGLVKEALTERYEKRFKNPPPNGMKDVFFELSSEVIIPHEEVIGKLVKTVEDDDEYDQEFEEEVASVLDEFLEQIK